MKKIVSQTESQKHQVATPNPLTLGDALQPKSNVKQPHYHVQHDKALNGRAGARTKD